MPNACCFLRKIFFSRELFESESYLLISVQRLLSAHRLCTAKKPTNPELHISENSERENTMRDMGAMGVICAMVQLGRGASIARWRRGRWERNARGGPKNAGARKCGAWKERGWREGCLRRDLHASCEDDL